jgi:hypothetical protein
VPYNKISLNNTNLLKPREIKYDINHIRQQPNVYSVEWNAMNYPSGIYFYKLQAGDFTQTRKMTLIK